MDEGVHVPRETCPLPEGRPTPQAALQLWHSSSSAGTAALLPWPDQSAHSLGYKKHKEVGAVETLLSEFTKCAELKILGFTAFLQTTRANMGIMGICLF